MGFGTFGSAFGFAFGFEELSGGNCEDLTGSDNDGTLQSGGQRTPNGYFGRGIELDGSAGNVGLGPLDFPGGAVTCSMWFNADDFGIADADLEELSFSDAEEWIAELRAMREDAGKFGRD